MAALHKKTVEDYIITWTTYVIYTFFAFVCVYPFYYILINSVSANDLSERGKVLFVPLKFHLSNYQQVMKINGLVNSFKVSILRTVVGTMFTVVVSGFLGYMFTKETLWKRKFWYRFVVATMYFNAGIIPWFITMRNLHLTNNFWAYIFPVAVQPFYIVLCKTFVESIPLCNRSKNCNRSNNWLDYRKYNAEEDLQGSRTINNRRFFQRFRNTFDKGLTKNYVERLNRNRENICPEIICKMKVSHGNKPRNNTCIKIRSCNYKTVPELSLP